MRNRQFILIALASVAAIALLMQLPAREFEQPENGNSGKEAAPSSSTIALPAPNSPPFGSKLPSTSLPTQDVTGSIPRPEFPIAAPRDASLLRKGMNALTSRDIVATMSSIEGLGKDSIDREILTWATAMSGQSVLSSDFLAKAAQTLSHWPGLNSINGNYERALAREKPSTEKVLAVFSAKAPVTIDGKLLLARASMAAGERDKAQEIVRALWLSERLDDAQTKTIQSEFQELLSKQDNQQRFFYLAYNGRLSQAKDLSESAGTQSLYRAWALVAERSKQAPAAIKAVDATWQKHPSYLYLQIRQLRQQSSYEKAAALFASMPKDKAKLGDASAWWSEMRIIARGLIDLDQFDSAYRLLSQHPSTSSEDIADAEFHAGWLALRYLNDAKRAELHFRKLLIAAATPANIARAHYWLGRSVETRSTQEAKEHYKLAAQNSANFYGQLANARLGNETLKIAPLTISDEDRLRLTARPLMRAIERLELAGYGWRADLLYRTLANEIASSGEIALLAQRVEARGDHNVSLQIGRNALSRADAAVALAFPLGAIPPTTDIGDAGRALAYAIGRQESAFNINAVSPADARGLLQILPGTAQEVAKQIGEDFVEARLTSDAAYNARLGAHYLSQQISRYKGSYILTFIAYNAGPRRVDQWIKRYGDPREMDINDVVDWIERIPFPETRNYVQRVMENYQVYKARLDQSASIESDLTKGRL